MAVLMQQTGDTAANWASNNPVLASRQLGVETDTGKFKIGDGVTHWTTLGYAGGSAPDATTGSKGVVQLTGDLGGTAAAPTVPGLAGKLPSSDPSVTNARTPTAHAASHAPGGVDPLTTADLPVSAVISSTQGLTISGTPTAGQVLTASSATTAGWSAGGGSGGVVVVAPVMSSGTLVAGKFTPVDATSGNSSQALPTGASQGTQIAVQRADATSNTLSLTGSIRGVGSSTIALNLGQFETLLLVADAAGSWWPLASHKTLSSLDARYAPLASPALTGSPTAPTATIGDSTTKLATTSFATAAAAAARAASITPAGHTICYWGDSITAFGTATDPGAPPYATNPTAVSSQSFTNWMNVLLGQRFSAVADLATGGETTAQLVARLAPTIWAAAQNYSTNQCVYYTPTPTTVSPAALVTTAATTTINVAPLPEQYLTGQLVALASGSQSQIVKLSVAAAQGATAITINATIPQFAFPAGSTVTPLRMAYVANAAHTAGASFDPTKWIQTLTLLASPLELAPVPQWVQLMIGTNDIASTSVVSATVLANIIVLCNTLLANGSKVLLCTITPNYAVMPNTAQKMALAFINRGIRNYGRATAGIVIADTYAAAVDPVLGQYKPGFTADQTHPNCPGAFALAQECANAIGPYVAGAPVLSSSNMDLENLLTNGMMTGTQQEVDTLAMVGGATGGNTVLAVSIAGVVYTCVTPVNWNDTSAVVAAAIQAAVGPSGQTLPAGAVVGSGGPWSATGTMNMTWAASVGAVDAWTSTNAFTGGSSPHLNITRSAAGGLATSWTSRYGVGQATLSKVPRTDLAGGEWQQVKLTNWASGSYDIFQTFAGAVVGGVYQAQVEFQGDPGWGNVGHMGLDLQFQGGTQQDALVFDDNAVSSGMPSAVSMFSGVLKSVPMTAPVPFTSSLLFLRFGSVPSSGVSNGSIRWGRASVIRIA